MFIFELRIFSHVNPNKAGLFEGSFSWGWGGYDIQERCAYDIVTKNHTFTFSAEDTFFEKPQWGGGGGVKFILKGFF